VALTYGCTFSTGLAANAFGAPPAVGEFSAVSRANPKTPTSVAVVCTSAFNPKVQFALVLIGGTDPKLSFDSLQGEDLRHPGWVPDAT
jgi:hypothetical protein